MIITSIERNESNNKYDIFIDGEYFFSVSDEIFYSLGLYEKKEMTAKELDYIRKTALFKEAKYTAIKYISTRNRTARDITSKLRSCGYDNEIILEVIDYLTTNSYVNDQQFARKYIIDRLKFNPKSKNMLGFELERKGIQRNIIEDTLNQYDFHELELAINLVNKKYGKSTKNFNNIDDKTKRRIVSFLLNKGFNYDIVFEALNQIYKISTDTDGDLK